MVLHVEHLLFRGQGNAACTVGMRWSKFFPDLLGSEEGIDRLGPALLPLTRAWAWDRACRIRESLFFEGLFLAKSEPVTHAASYQIRAGS